MAAADLDVTMREIIIASLRYYLDNQDEVEDYLFGRQVEERSSEGEGPQLSHDEVKRRLEQGTPAAT